MLGVFRSAIVLGAIAVNTVSAQTAPNAGIELKELRPGIWLHTSYYVFPDGSRTPSNGLVVRDGNGLLLIDSAWGEIQSVHLLEQIQKTIGLPVRRALITHAHGDRLSGADVFRSRGIPVFAHPLTIRLAAASGIPIPSDSLTGLTAPGSVVRLGNVEVFYPGPAHAPDNIMVWVPEQRVLFGGCAVRAASATTLGNVAHADTTAWPASIRRVVARYPQAALVVPGHGESGGPALLTHTLELLLR
jgi:metallo-beta-lactamase class B VIM